MSKKLKNDNEILLENVRLSYLKLFDEYKTGKHRHQFTILIDKKDIESMELLKACIDSSEKYGIDKQLFKQLPGKYNAIKDCDSTKENGEFYNDYELNHYRLSVTTYFTPTIKDENGNNLKIDEINSDVLYSGAYINIIVATSPYKFDIQDENGKTITRTGIRFSTNGIKKVKDGERLGYTPTNPDDVL